jgi:diguanylate cyclase (GGDEF)-like protein
MRNRIENHILSSALLKFAITAATWAIYIGLFFLLYEKLGQPANALVALPVVFSGWVLGQRWGAIIGLLAYPLNIGLFFLVNHPDMATIITKGIPPTIALLIVGWVVGRMSDLQLKLKEQLSQIELLQSQLQKQAIRDPLTGLFNRRHMHESLERERSRAQRTNTSVSVMILDLDQFKQINDTHGHLAGDMMLESIGNIIRENIRAEDIPCRYGGEEFLLVMPGSGIEMALECSERIRKKIQLFRMPHQGMELSITASIGIAVFPIHASSMNELLMLADQALYQAKGMGKNRSVLYQSA